MKIICFIFAIVMVLSLMNSINANERRKERSTNLFRERLLDLFLEAKRREILSNKFKESEKELPRSDDNLLNGESDEDHHGRTFVRRKVVGISDNPF